MNPPVAITSGPARGGEVCATPAPPDGWKAKVVRFGFVVKGLTYLAIGAVAAISAGGYGHTFGPGGLTRSLSANRWGGGLLLVVAVGFAAYGLEFFLRAAAGFQPSMSDWKDKIRRLFLLMTGVGQWSIAAVSALAAIGLRESSASPIPGAEPHTSDHAARRWVGYALEYQLGPAVLVGVGLGIIGVGVFQFVQAWRVDFQRRLDPARTSPDARRRLVWLGRFGYFSRGVVFCALGLYITLAAYRHNPAEAHGLGGTLHALDQVPLGQPLIIALAAGLGAYGLLLILQAKYLSVGRA